MAWFGFVRNSIAEDQQTTSRFLQERKAPPLNKGHLRALKKKKEVESYCKKGSLSATPFLKTKNREKESL